MAADANEETGESSSGRQRTPLSMLLPCRALVVLGLAVGVLAHPVSLYPPAPAGVTPASAILALIVR
jgi:hypothetical protein